MAIMKRWQTFSAMVAWCTKSRAAITCTSLIGLWDRTGLWERVTTVPLCLCRLQVTACVQVTRRVGDTGLRVPGM